LYVAAVVFKTFGAHEHENTRVVWVGELRQSASNIFRLVGTTLQSIEPTKRLLDNYFKDRSGHGPKRDCRRDETTAKSPTRCSQLEWDGPVQGIGIQTQGVEKSKKGPAVVGMDSTELILVPKQVAQK
jgi:hypothetical protein